MLLIEVTAKLVEFFPWGSVVNGLLVCCHSGLTITVVNFILQRRNLSDTQLQGEVCHVLNPENINPSVESHLY